MTTTFFEKILKKMMLKVMFTVRNSRTGKEKIKRDREETIILRGKPSQNEGKNHGTITETLLLI